MSADPNYPPGVTERDISYREPARCETCRGERELNLTPCCGVAFVQTDDDFLCAKCGERYESRKCPECDGEGVLWE